MRFFYTIQYLISMTALLFLSTGFRVAAQDVRCTLEVASRGVAGTEIPVKVTISKGDNNDFARFQQELPPGFDVKPLKTANADFSYRDHTVDFIWLKLPETPEIEIQYMLIPDVRLTGIFDITGRFSYIHDNDRDEIYTPVQKIEIVSPGDQNKLASKPVAGTEGKYKLAVFRDKPVMQPDGSGYIVHLLVSRAGIEKLARIEETIPKGYSAENIDGKGAIFSYKDGKLKYIWMTLPEEPLFMVSYRLRPVGGTTGIPAPDGIFAFMKDNEPASIPIIPVDQQFPSGAESGALSDLYASLIQDASLELIQKGVPKDLTQAAPSAGAKSAADLLAEEQQETVAGQSENKPGQKTEIVTHKPEPQKGIYFRVQIIATSKPIEIEAYFRKHNIPGKIYREHIGGLYKYTTGSFSLYSEARAFIDNLFDTTDIDEAFVTAYRGNQRISVREALNATGQKWFK